jgi:putative glutamine amidotransferase
MPSRPLIGVTYSSSELEPFRLWPLMFQGVVAAGGVPIAIDCALPPPGIGRLVDRLDGLLISGGVDVQPSRYGASDDDPLVTRLNVLRDQAELAALAAARQRHMPVLAVCRGAQVVNVAFGGTLIIDLERDMASDVRHRTTPDDLIRPAHEVDVVAGSLLSKWHEVDGPISVNSQHHQGIKELAPALTASATSPDGLVEGFELADERLVGVQWHPEVYWPTEEHALRLLSNFVLESAQRDRRG